MNTKTMEGLIGAGKNINLVNTPMRVFKEARRKGDTAKMERAMGYVNEFEDKAGEYRAQADEGTQEEAKENRKKAELEREEAIRKRREERERPEEEIAARRGERKESAEGIDDASANLKSSAEKASESRNAIDDIVDTVEISEAGKILSENQTILPENAGYSESAYPKAQNLN